MLRSAVVLGVAGVLLSGCTQELTLQEKAVEGEVVRDRVTEWARAFSNRTVSDVAPFYHQVPELTVAWLDGNRTRGWDEEVHEAQRAFFRSLARANFVIQDLVVEVLASNVAVTTFRHSTDIILTSTDREIFSGQGTLVWTKDPEDGLWKIHAAHVSRNAAGS